MGILSEDDKKVLAEKFEKEMVNPVPISLVKSDNCNYCDPVEELLKELAEVSSGKILVKVSEMNPTLSKILRVNRGPIVLIGSKGEVRYTGAPLGEEGWAFIETIAIASNDKHGLDEYVDDLRSLDRKVRIETVVTPTCPYCPYAVLIANRIAIASRGKVISDTIEAYEFPEIADKWGITAVPTVILSVEEPYSGNVFAVGVPKEKDLIRAILRFGITE
ncbi:MAG: thioredoxin family protein [Candidatus Njordarchaeales archaeon]